MTGLAALTAAAGDVKARTIFSGWPALRTLSGKETVWLVVRPLTLSFRASPENYSPLSSSNLPQPSPLLG